MNGLSLMGEDMAIRQGLCRKQFKEPLSHWNFAAFPAGSLRLGDDDYSPNKVDVATS